MTSVKISSNFKERGVYVFGGEEIRFNRIYGGISGNTAVIIGEDTWKSTPIYYLLADVVCKRFNDLIKTLNGIKRLKVDEYFWKPNREHEEILTRHHVQAFRARKPQLFLSSVLSDTKTLISEVEAIQSCLNPKRLYLFNESRVPSALQSLPTDITKLKPEDAPLVASLGYALTMLLDIDDVEDDDMNLTGKSYGR